MTEDNMEVTSISTEAKVETQPESTGPVADAPQPSVEDLAAHDFRNLIPDFYKKLEPLSRRQVQKVLMALVEYPLETQELRWSYPEEKEAFYIGMQLFDCKFVLMRAVIELTRDKAKLAEFKADLDKLAEEKREAQDVVQG